MLKTRVIPVLLWNDHGLCKPVRFNRPGRFVGSLMSAARVYENRTCDELILLDIDATPDKRGPRFAEIEKFTSLLFMPLAIGGGISSITDIRDLLSVGADKIVLKTYGTPAFIQKAAEKFGSQCITVAIDYRARNKAQMEAVVSHALLMQESGAGEIVLTNMDRDGTRTGYDLAVLKMVSSAVKIPVVANGGCRSWEDMQVAIKHGAHAVAASSMFLYDDITPQGCREQLDHVGIPTRIEVETDTQHMTAFGETKTARQWSRDPRCNTSYGTLQSRVRRGVPAETAITSRLLRLT